jgi:hypothetical protein
LSKTNSVIEVNGNRYDAITGQILNASNKARHSASTSKKRVIDGFVIGAHNAKNRASSKNVSKAAPAKTPAQKLHHRPQKTRTLMRTGLAKPATKSGPESKQSKRTASQVNPVRELRARTITQHVGVKRFGHFSQKNEVIHNSPVAKPKLHSRTPTEIVTPARVPSMVTSVSHQKLEKMLDEALLRADAHKQMMGAKKQSRYSLSRFIKGPRWIRYSLAGLAILFIVGTLVWRNLPAVAVHVASAKAGVQAAVPAYTPDGFSYAKLHYVPGAITMQYVAKDQPTQNFVLTQQRSNWTSATLEANELPKDGNVQTSEVKGTTVYIYGEHNDAAWVNRNILYSLKNKANLTSDQVLKIAQSL